MNIKNLLLDTGVLLAFLISTAPHFTGNLIHEWLGIGLAAALIVHVFLHWDWITAVGIKFFKNLWQVSRLQFFVDIFIFIAFITLITTGLMMSKSVLSTLGIQLAMTSRSVKMIHSTASNAAVLLSGVHLALHWNWIVCMAKKYVLSPVQSIFRPRNAARPATIKSTENNQA
jgi:hypothetical protein